VTRPTAQVLTLLELLQSGGVRTAAELAGRLGVDERSVRRYVEHLIDLDVPVESVRGRYGGYRLASGYRLPPLMLSDEEALAVLLGLAAGRRAGLLPVTGTAGETAAAKIRRVLPRRLAERLDSVLASVAFTSLAGTTAPGTSPPGTAASGGSPASAAPDTAILLTMADAVRHHRPVAVRYTAADGRHSQRTFHPYGLVAHSGRWYATGQDTGRGEDRTFRLDRITDARTLPGSFDPPANQDPAERVLSSLARAPHRHEVTLRVQGTAEQVRARLPASIAAITEPPADLPSGAVPEPSDTDRARWLLVELRVESLDWLPGLLASLDLPFVIERPGELRELVLALAGRLAASARRPGTGPGPTPAGTDPAGTGE
jgi:predicted DNA-binding transcriptional regulator YafY